VFCNVKYRGRCPKDGGVKKTATVTATKSNRNLSLCRIPQHCGALQNNIGKKAVLQSSSPVFCNVKYRGGVRRTEGLKKQQQQQNQIATSPLPCPAALRGATKQYREKTALQSSSPVLCTAKYRGGVRRTERLKNNDIDGNKIKSQPLPLPCPAALRGATKQYREEVAFQSSSPVFCNVKYRGGVRRTEGLKNNDSNNNKIKSQSLPLPCPAALRGVAQRYRGSARRARGLKQK